MKSSSASIPSKISSSFLDKEIFLIFLLSLNIIDWSSIIFAILIQVFLFSAGMIFNKKIKTGKFGASMNIVLNNDGPVTIVIDSKAKE